MNIDELTFGQIKELIAQFGSAAGEPKSPLSLHIGKKCIIRTYASGVHFGEVIAVSGRSVDLVGSRRLWRWDAAPHGVSLSEIANYGTVGARSRVCELVPSIGILDALEIIPCSAEAISEIEGAEVFRP